MIKIGDNLSYQGDKFNFERDCVKTIAEIKALDLNAYPDGFDIFCLENRKVYRLNKNGIESADLGKWEIEASAEIKTLTSAELNSTSNNTGLYIAYISNIETLIYIFISNNVPFQLKITASPASRYFSNGAWSSWQYSSILQIKANGYYVTKNNGEVNLGTVIKSISNGSVKFTSDGNGNVNIASLIDGCIAKPTEDGTSGQVLMMTDDGVKWKTPSSGDGITPGTGEGLTEAQKKFLGQSADLQTEAKNSLPSAINEVAKSVETLGQETGYKKVAEYTFPNDRMVLEIAAVDFSANTITLVEPHGLTDLNGYACWFYPVLFGNENTAAPLYGQSDIFAAAVEQLNFLSKPLEIVDDYTLKFKFKSSTKDTSNFNKQYYRLMRTSDGTYQRNIKLAEECKEILVTVDLSHSTGVLFSGDVSVSISHCVGFSRTELASTFSTPYSDRLSSTRINKIEPQYSANKSIGSTVFYNEVWRNGPALISNFQFYSYSMPYFKGDKINVYKIS